VADMSKTKLAVAAPRQALAGYDITTGWSN